MNTRNLDHREFLQLFTRYGLILTGAGLLALVPCFGVVTMTLDGSDGSCLAGPTEDLVRPPAVAGQFYPADPGHLSGAIEAYLKDAHPPSSERPLALIAPHAGYIYSGQIAADAYKQAAGFAYELIVILGTNHTQPLFDGVSFYDGVGYRTPLGVARIDRRTTEALLQADPSFTFEPAVHEREHSVEVQVPFIQTVFPGTKIVAAIVGSPEPDLTHRLGRVLAALLSGRKALIVASSDLSHYPGAEDAYAADSALLAATVTLNPETVRATIEEEMRRGRPGLVTCACGEGPLLVALQAAKRLGATGARVISYAHSGDTAVGNPDRVVGYGAVALTSGPAVKDTASLRRPLVAEAEAPLDGGDKAALLALARETIHRYLTTETTPLARGFAPTLNRKQGAFVTLDKHGELRGCIGHMAEDRSLCQVVGAMALQAAFNDRRFSPLRWNEWPQVEIEISLLTPFQKVTGPEAIVVGRDGVVIKKSGRTAVFLPHVATEQGWSLEEMLAHLCRKAGLPQDAWRQGAEFSTFQAVVFSESEEPGGETPGSSGE